MDLHERDLNFEQTLDDSKTLLDDAARAASEGYSFTLESILAEFGGADAPAAPEGELPPTPQPAVTVTQELPEEDDESAAEDDGDAVAPALDTPQSFSLQQVLERTVRDVLDEQREEPVLDEQPRRRGLFSRKKLVETEELYDAAPSEQPDEPEDEPPAEPEPPIAQTVAEYRDAAQNTRRAARLALPVTLLMWAPQLLDYFGLMPALYREEPLLSVLPYCIALALLCALGREVFVYAAEKLFHGKVTYELLTSLLCLASLADMALLFFLPARSASGALALHSVAALAMTAALHGRAALFQALYATFRVAALGEAPYVVTRTAGGAAKRRGGAAGFSDIAQRGDVSDRWQAVALPVVLAGAIVFAVLATVEAGSWALLAWNLSAILAGADALAFPLTYPLPLRRVARRLSKGGSALAGYRGAADICRSNCLILTDSDLFPPGTVTFNGMKIFGESLGKVFSYAATVSRAAELGIARLFENLLAQEGGQMETLSDLSFYEEGGVSGTIRGETVLLGTASFCRKMGIALPAGLKLQTGVFLAVDGTLIAIFAVKYMAAENVDWALRALRRARITPVLAVRDGNITPALLKRKFGTDARAVYPSLSTRLALSGGEGGQPCALICREGLTPYAELAIGAKRLCRAARVGNVLSLVASVSGALLAFYLSFSGAYALFTPLKLAAFLGLWALAALFDGFFADKY